MCFSAEASFASAALLVPTGVYCLRAAERKAPRLWPLAVVPCLFGAQQAFEGFVWLGLQSGDERLVRSASVAYIFFALAFWPTWFSLAAFLIEPSAGRRKLLAIWTVLSTGWFWLAFLPVVADSSRSAVQVVHHSIHYEYADAGWLDPTVRWPLRILYVTTASAPLLATSVRRVLLAPVSLGVVSAGVTVYLFDHAFTSIWCLFSAILSISFVYAIEFAPGRPPHPARRLSWLSWLARKGENRYGNGSRPGGWANS